MTEGMARATSMTSFSPWRAPYGGPAFGTAEIWKDEGRAASAKEWTMGDGPGDCANGRVPYQREPTAKEFARDLIAGKVNGAPAPAVELARAYLERVDPTDAELARDAAKWAYALGTWRSYVTEQTLERRAAQLIERRVERPIETRDEPILAYLAGRLGHWPPEDR